MQTNRIICADVLEGLEEIERDSCQLIIADPPYFRVLTNEAWDDQWPDEEAYLAWTEQWVELALQKLKDDGLMFVFGQLGKREHLWIHAWSRLCRIGAFHDMIIWDRAVGYNERGDSFTPQYENILLLRKNPDAQPFFNKDAVRVPYDKKTVEIYLRDKRYKDLNARREHLEKGKYATNILRVPSLKGSSREKVGHPSQKPEKLISMLVRSSTKPSDIVLDPFLGSGTTAVVCEKLDRQWIGIEKDPTFFQMAETRIAATADPT